MPEPITEAGDMEHYDCFLVIGYQFLGHFYLAFANAVHGAAPLGLFAISNLRPPVSKIYELEFAY